MSIDLLFSPLVIAIFFGTSRIFLKWRWMNVVEVAIIGLLTASVLYFQHFATYVVGGWSSAIGIEVSYDSTSFWFILSLLIVWSSVKLRFEKWNSIMESLIDYLFASLYALFISNDLFNIYVTIELTSLISFLIVGHGENPSKIWAALKYMFLSSVALSLYLFGTIILYSEIGVLSIGALKNESLPAFALAFILVALLVKSGTLGLSAWLIDVYSMSETPVSMLLSGTAVNAGLFALVRIYPLLPLNLKRFGVGIGIFSAFTGAVYAISERKSKRILAFSTTSQMGIAISLMFFSPLATSLYAFAHSIAKSLLFSRNGKFSTALGAFSLIGIPPLAGYFAKLNFEKAFPHFSLLMIFLTSIYLVKVFKGLKWKFSFFEFLLEGALLSLCFFMPIGGFLSILKVLLIAGIGVFVGFFIQNKTFPLKDVFGLEEGIAYQMWALVIMAFIVFGKV